QRLYTVNTQHVGVTFKHVVLPVWLAPYRYRQQTYQILVNGRNGRVCGTRPYSWIKIALFVLVILSVLGIVLLIASRARGAEPVRRADAVQIQASYPLFPRSGWERTPGRSATRLQMCAGWVSHLNGTQSVQGWRSHALRGNENHLRKRVA